MRHILLARRGCAARVLTACWLAACTSGGLNSPATVPTEPVGTLGTFSAATTTTSPPATSTSTTSLVTVAGDSSAATPTPSGHMTPADVVLSPSGPWRKVDAAPGISTPGLFYELLPQVWVYLPTVEDVANGVLWTFNEEDRPVLEGYLAEQASRLRPGADVVLRPEVLGDGRTDTSAIVADCVRPVDGAAPVGLDVTLDLVAGRWTVTRTTHREDACWAA